MILAREFFPFGAPSPISRELAGEKCLLISRAIAKKSTDPWVFRRFGESARLQTTMDP
jgi:hypothetical protein